MPEVIRWGARSNERHAAFFALSASVDHLVPHARGGDGSLGNLVTACQSCNLGRGGWLIEEVGLIDPRTRPPAIDAWDGLDRVLRSGPVRPRNRPANTVTHQAHEDWFRQLDSIEPGLSNRLLGLLDACNGLDLSWSLNKVLLVRMRVGDVTLELFGIEPDGIVHVPWFISEHKAIFRSFAEYVAQAIPGSVARETKKLWVVSKADKSRVSVLELLDASTLVKAALDKLHATLRNQARSPEPTGS